jgi:prevent-host-death family protein
MLEVMPLTQARQHFLQLAQKAEKGLGQYVLTKHGRPVAVLLGYEQYRRLEETARLLADGELASRLPEALTALEQGEGRWLDET